MEKERENILKILFGQYPNEEGFHMTSDNQAFTNKHKGDAINHAKTLKDKEVIWAANPKQKLSTEEVAKDEGDDAETEALVARYKELFGTNPQKNMKIETLQKKIAEKEAEGK